MKAIKSDSDSDSDEQKRSPGFSGKNRGVTPSVAAPGVTHPSDATGGLNNEHYYKDHCNDASPTVKKSGEDMKVEKDEFLIDDGKSAMMT